MGVFTEALEYNGLKTLYKVGSDLERRKRGGERCRQGSRRISIQNNESWDYP